MNRLKRIWHIVSGERRANEMVARAVRDYEYDLVLKPMIKVMVEVDAKHLADRIFAEEDELLFGIGRGNEEDAA